MKKNLLLALALTLCVTSAFSQHRPVVFREGDGRAKMIQKMHPGTPDPQPAIPPAAGFRVLEAPIGSTNFDLQSVGSLGRRIGEPEAGKVSGIWQIAFDQAGGYTDRGTGYNLFDGTAWGDWPEERIETLRSGYPSFTTTAEGNEVAVSHKALTATSWALTTYIKKPSDTEWTAAEVPSDVPAGCVWAKIAAGGPDGNTLHMVGISLNPAFGGVTYQGIDNHPLYWRSTDGGASWDVVDLVIPGLDSNYYHSISAEAYTVEANGETVAIAILEPWGDIAVFKSDDNGDTWVRHLINDFPLDKWDGTPYAYTDIPADPNAPDSISMFTTDGTGSLAIDDDGKVHLFFGEMYVFGLQDSARYLHLGTNGIGYWNEDLGEVVTIAGAEDHDGDQIVTVGGDIGAYRYTNSAAATMPTASIDDEGNIYLIYSAFHEAFLNVDGLTYRHIFILKSEDGGQTWSAPYDLVNEEITDSPEFIEASFPSLPPRTKGQIQVLYQQDYVPGLTPDGETVSEQYIVHAALDKTTFGLPSAVQDGNRCQSCLSVSPNPAHEVLFINLELPSAGPVSAMLVNQLGEQVLFRDFGQLPVGQQTLVMGIQSIPLGMYFLKIEAGTTFWTEKVVVR